MSRLLQLKLFVALVVVLSLALAVSSVSADVIIKPPTIPSSASANTVTTENIIIEPPRPTAGDDLPTEQVSLNNVIIKPPTIPSAAPNTIDTEEEHEPPPG